MNKLRGFTLIEMMVVVAIIAIIAAIALPSYDNFLRKKDIAAAQQEMQRIATELERHKMKNFSYAGYATHSFEIPAGSATKKYTITVVDAQTKGALSAITLDGVAKADGQNWIITAVRKDTDAQPKHPDLLLSSKGERCMTTATNSAIKTYSCASISEKW